MMVRAFRAPLGRGLLSEPVTARLFLSFLWLTLLNCGALPARAQQWYVEPAATVELLYEDNISLEVDQPQSSFGARITGAARAFRATENSSLGVGAAVNVNEYFDASDLSNTQGALGFDGSYRTARSQFGLDAAFSTQSTLTSEVATTGVSDINRQQYRIDVRPSWSYLLSERGSLGLGIQYSDVFYDDVDDTSLYNYRSGDISLSGEYRLTERANLRGVVSYGRYWAQGIDNEAENVDIEVGADYRLSEISTLEVLAGLRRTREDYTDTDGTQVTDDTAGPIFSLGFRRSLPSGANVNLEIRRAITPSGSGQVLDSTGLGFGLDYPLDDRFAMQFAARAYDNRTTASQSEDSDYTYAEGGLGATYRLRPGWTLGIGYRHRWQDRAEDPESTQGYTVQVTLAWRGNEQ